MAGTGASVDAVSAATGMLEMHAPGGTDVIVAASVFLLGGAALAWTLVRRDRPDDRPQAQPADSQAATRIPPKIADRLPELLDATAGDIDPEAARTDAGRAAARDLLAADEAYAVLAERVRARLPHGTTAEAAAGSRPPSRQQVEDAVPPVEAAALVVLEAQLRARARAWELHLRAGSDPLGASVPRSCSLNPFHGQTTAAADGAAASAAEGAVALTTEGAAASAAEAPVCAACREALAAGREPDVLRVRTRSGAQPLADVDPAYAQGFAGSGDELVRAVQEPPTSGPVGRRGGGRDATRSLLGAIAVPVAGLVLAVVVGVLVSILVAGDGAGAGGAAASAGESAGPVVLGYPLLNALRGAGIGALAAVLVFGILAAAINGVRKVRSGRHTPGEGFDPNRRDELDTPVVRENVRRLGGT